MSGASPLPVAEAPRARDDVDMRGSHRDARRGSRAPSVALALALLALLPSRAATAAEGAARVHVVLVDGGELQGELVEKIPGEAITIQLATGEVRRIPWASVANVREVAAERPARDDDAKRDVVQGWPRPDRTPPTFRGERLTYGLTVGVGTPTGYLGGVVGYSPAPWIELELGAGLGGAFGPAAAATARVGVPILGVIRFGLGVGGSLNWLSGGARAAGGEHAGAPALARFVNFEIFQDYALGRRTFLRLVSGLAVLTNVSDYRGVCPRDATGASSCAGEKPGLPLGLRYAESRADLGGAAVIPSFGLALIWMTS